MKRRVLAAVVLLSCSLFAAGCVKSADPDLQHSAVVSPVPVVSPAASVVVPVQVAPPATPQIMPPAPTNAAPISDDSRAVADYLAWVQQFDAAQNKVNSQQSDELMRRLQVYGNNGTSEENARPVREQQVTMRQSAAQDITTFQNHTPPTACAGFAQTYNDSLSKYAQSLQPDIISNPQAISTEGITEARRAAGAELEKIFTAYPSVNRFSLN